MTEFMIELFSEEIPARMQRPGIENFKNLLIKGLKEKGLPFDAETITSHVTPQRMIVAVSGLPLKQEDQKIERKGPKIDAPEKAQEGFLRSVGLTMDQCEKRETEKGTFLYANIEKKGQKTKDVLPAVIDAAMRAMPWPKSMKWGKGSFTWVRPIHRILAVLNGQVLDGSFDLGKGELIPFTNETTGHRFLAPDTFAVTSFKQYKQELAERKTFIDSSEREAIIVQQIADKLPKGLRYNEDFGLQEEVAGLVEFPHVLIGKIDDEFMDVPQEALITAMKKHQKYFSVLDQNGKLAPHFIFVANITTQDDSVVISGNERVLRARLADAKFFWDEDRKVTLESRVEALKGVTFHEKLGTMRQKTERLEALAKNIALKIGADAESAKRAAHLCKADLTTGMVGEFANLQGIMGQYYAEQDGENPDVSQAIKAHYQPAGQNDTVPTEPVSIAVALADKLDSLIAFFSVGIKPTGSKDPYALRRAALGVIRLIQNNQLRLPLREILEQHQLQEMAQLAAKDVVAELLTFILDRYKVYLRGEGEVHDALDAVLSLNDDDLLVITARIQTLKGFLGKEEGQNLLAAYKRANNITKGESSTTKEIDEDLFERDEETALHAQFEKVENSVTACLNTEEYEDAMKALATLRAPLDAFFEKVTVNADDENIKNNRHAMLSKIVLLMNKIADFSKLEG
ncbi:MAG: glycine--tRNA ligase subunit beta [Alphaproteobacteria bacterium]